MSAKDTLRLHQTAIEETLSEDPWLILNKLHEKRLITTREYRNIKSIKKSSSYGTDFKIVDNIRDKGEARCNDFLDLLNTDETITKVYPGLQDIELSDTVRPQRPKQKTSSPDYRDDVTTMSDRRKAEEMAVNVDLTMLQELKSRITALCLFMTYPTGGSLRHGSAIDAGHFFKGVEKIFPLKNPPGSKWILGGVSDTIYKGKDAEVNGWGKFYLPKEVKMAVIGEVVGTSCPNEQLVLMICEDEGLYAYDGEELHAVASHVDQLLNKGIEYPAAKTYYKGEPFKDTTKEQWAEVRKGAVGQRLEEEHRKLVTSKKSRILKILKSTKQPKVAKSETIPRPVSVLDETEYYALTHNPRGRCVIINIEKFTGQGMKNRTGTQEDTKALTDVFTRLGFKVDVEKDLTADEIRTKLQNLGKDNFVDHDALVVCVLSRGQEGVVYGSDERTVPLKELMQPFTRDRAPTLAGKPKLFFIEASQGSDDQKGTLHCPPQPRQGELHLPRPEAATQVTVADHYEEDKGKTRLEDDAHVSGSWTPLPSDADFLMSMSTVPEFTSLRNTSTGSVYTQELCRQLMKSAGSSEMDDIMTILTRVNREVNNLNPLSYKKMPQPFYTLTKKLVLKYV